jgi:bifunctional non-homologous end joining protein LigD
VFGKIKPFEIAECPFANLREKKAGRWGAGLTAAKMAECRWLKPKLVAHFEFVEWTEDRHLRHSRFVALREDKKAIDEARKMTGGYLETLIRRYIIGPVITFRR